MKNNSKWINSYSLLCIVHLYLYKEAMKFEKWPHSLSDMDCEDVSTTGEMMHFLFFFLIQQADYPSSQWFVIPLDYPLHRGNLPATPPQMWKNMVVCFLRASSSIFITTGNLRRSINFRMDGGGVGLITQVPSSGHRYRKRIRKIRGVFCFGRGKKWLMAGMSCVREREAVMEMWKVCCVEASIL